MSHWLCADQRPKIGLSDNFRRKFHQTYFDAQILQNDYDDLLASRHRGRDVIRYEWRDGTLILSENDTTEIADRSEIIGKWTCARVELLADHQGEELVRALLQLVPLVRRQPAGTFGVNLLRNFAGRTTAPHHEMEEFVINYVLNRIGAEAETYLYDPNDLRSDGSAAAPMLRTQLGAGSILIFEDRKFMQATTSLINLPNETASYDALVCTIDY